MVLSNVTIANLFFLVSNAITLSWASNLILERHKSLSQYLLRTFIQPKLKYQYNQTYLDLVFLASDVLVTSLLSKPYYLISIHFSTALLSSNSWMDWFEDVQAKRCLVGWNTIFPMSALLFPLFSSWTRSPPSEEKILMMWPRDDADAIRVPSELTAIAPISVLSCARI